jgi:hypothetical protein
MMMLMMMLMCKTILLRRAYLKIERGRAKIISTIIGIRPNSNLEVTLFEAASLHACMPHTEVG